MTGHLRVVCGVLIWAVINGLVIKDAGNMVSPTILGALMSLVGVILFLPQLARHPWSGFSRAQKFALIGLGLSAALNNSLFYTALTLAAVHKVALIHYFASVLAVVWFLVIPIFREKLDRASLVSILLGIAGLVVMTGGDWLEHKLWLYFALGSAVFYSLEIVFSRRVSAENVSPQFSAFTKLFFQLLIMPIVGLMLGQSFYVPVAALGYIVFAGLLLYVSFILVFSGLTTVPAKHFSVLGYLDRIGAVAIGRFWWGETFGPRVWIGGLMILVAELPIIFKRNKKEA